MFALSRFTRAQGAKVGLAAAVAASSIIMCGPAVAAPAPAALAVAAPAELATSVQLSAPAPTPALPLALPPAKPLACNHGPAPLQLVDATSGSALDVYEGEGNHTLTLAPSGSGFYGVDDFRVNGLVPGDCGMLTTSVINGGPRSGILRAFLQPVILTSPSGSAAAQQWFSEVELSTGYGVWPGLAPTPVIDLQAGGPLMVPPPDFPTNLPPSVAAQLGNLGYFMQVGCMAINEVAHFPFIIDFPYSPSKQNAEVVNADAVANHLSGGNINDVDDPAMAFQVFYYVNDDPDDQCDPPNLKVGVSSANANDQTGQVSWLVTVLNAGPGIALGTKVYLIVDGYNPQDWADGVNPPAGTSIVCNLNGGPAALSDPATGKCPAGQTKYFTDPARPDKQLIIWDLGAAVAPGAVIPPLTVSVPMAEVDSDGDVCVTAYVDSVDQPWRVPYGQLVDAHGSTRDFTAINSILAGTAPATFGTVRGSAGGYTIAAAWANYPGALLYDYAMHHWTPREPWRFDAGQLNNDDVNSDTDAWDYNGWVPRAKVPPTVPPTTPPPVPPTVAPHIPSVPVPDDVAPWVDKAWPVTPAGASRMVWSPLSKSGVSGLMLLLGAGLALGGRRLAASRR